MTEPEGMAWSLAFADRLRQTLDRVRELPKVVPTELRADELAAMIDHTALKADTTPPMIDTLCSEAYEHGFASVCVNSVYIPQCVQRLEGSGVAVCSVIGFPLGATLTDVKVHEAQRVIEEGATEVDMVIQVGLLKAREDRRVHEDITAVAEVCHAQDAIVKVIIETAMLTDREKVIACQIAVQAKADFVKTSTGYGGGGATVFDVALMREAVGPKLGVKASGGIRTRDDVEEMIAAGATRIGASAGVKIVTGEGGSSGRY